MEEQAVKGTVTSLSSMFPVEDVQKAVKRVQDAQAEKQRELDQVKEFIADNTNLMNLVQKLPEELHHDIMVPFGKAAFFPGRLIHTNEFLVLLGDGYYADRTAKQTVEILQRRGKVLDSQVESLKAMMKDLRAEASFFDTTASETAEDLVEIREEYVEEKSSEKASGSGPLKQDSPSVSELDNLKVEDEDEEYARIMSRLEELEKEELAADNENGNDENKQNNLDESDNESQEDEQAKTVFDQLQHQISLDNDLRHSEGLKSSIPLQHMEEKLTISEKVSDSNDCKKEFADQYCTGLTVQAPSKDAMSRGKNLSNNVKAYSAKKASVLAEVKENVTAVPLPRNEVSVQTPKPTFDSSRAFTGSVVEHTHNIQTNLREQIGTSSKPSDSQPSKPVSRFKMQRK